MDDIAWLLNLRRTDISYNPVFFSYLIFYPAEGENTTNKASLYIEKCKIEAEDVKEHLAKNNVSFYEYQQVFDHLKLLSEHKKKIVIDEASINYGLFELVSSDLIVKKENVVEHLKAVKSTVEQEGMR